MSTIPRSILAAAAISLLVATGRAADDLAPLLPSDTLLYVSLPDIPATKKDSEKTAFRRIMEDEEVVAFLAPLKKMAEQQGENAELWWLKDLQTAIDTVNIKSVALAITHVDPEEINRGPEGLGLIIDLQTETAEGLNSFVNALQGLLSKALEKEGKKIEESPLEIAGTTVKKLTVGEEGGIYRLDLSGTRTLLSFSRKSIESVLSNRAGGQSILPALPAFAAATSKTSSQGDEARVFVNTASLSRLILQAAPQPDAKGVLQYLMPESIAMATRFDGAIIRSSTYLGRPKDGMKILELIPQARLSQETLKRIPKDVMIAAAFAVATDKMWGFMKGFADTFEAGAGEMLDQQVAGLKEGKGVDLKADLLDQLSGDLLFYAMPPKGPLPIPGVVLSLGIRDAEKVKKTFNTLLEMAGDEIAVRGVAYKDTTFYTVAPAQEASMIGVQPAYAFLTDQLLLSLQVQDLKNAISRATGTSTSSLLDSDAFKQASGNVGLPQQFSMVTFTDMPVLVGVIYNAALQGVGLLAASPMADQIPIDLALLPSPNAITQHLFPSLSFVTVDPEGVTLKSASPLGDEMMVGAALMLGGVAGWTRSSSMSRAYDEPSFEEVEIAEMPSVGDEAPAFTLSTPEGQQVSLESLEGSVVVLDFWSTWAPAEITPGIQRLHEKYAQKSVKVYAVATWEDGDPKAYLKEHGYTFGLLLDGDEVAASYGISSLPSFIVIDKQGKIVLSNPGFDPDQAEKPLEEAIDKALEAD